MIHLSEVKDVVAIKPIGARKREGKGALEFHVTTEDRVWAFLAQDTAWMERWVEAIKGEIELIREQLQSESS
jgi:hypothetical protein